MTSLSVEHVQGYCSVCQHDKQAFWNVLNLSFLCFILGLKAPDGVICIRECRQCVQTFWSSPITSPHLLRTRDICMKSQSAVIVEGDAFYNYIHCTGLCCFNEMKDIRQSLLLFLGCVSVCLCVSQKLSTCLALVLGFREEPACTLPRAIY